MHILKCIVHALSSRHTKRIWSPCKNSILSDRARKWLSMASKEAEVQYVCVVADPAVRLEKLIKTHATLDVVFVKVVNNQTITFSKVKDRFLRCERDIPEMSIKEKIQHGFSFLSLLQQWPDVQASIAVSKS